MPLQHVFPQCVTVCVGVHMCVMCVREKKRVKIRSTVFHPAYFTVSMVSDVSMAPNRITTDFIIEMQFEYSPRFTKLLRQNAMSGHP